MDIERPSRTYIYAGPGFVSPVAAVAAVAAAAALPLLLLSRPQLLVLLLGLLTE